ncbi:MAG: ABC transporter permease, partial [Deltaproteobacteria bacterium]|nr:ABC transporter permease [Deltaproteobacteria bacterium]
MILGREVRQGTLRRLRLTRLGSAGLLGGVTLAQMLVATVQTVLIFLGALAVGYHAQGSIV